MGLVMKNLQVRLEDSELQEIRQAARDRQMTVSQWVRETLRQARVEGSQKSLEDKVQVVREAARHDFPTADIDQMLAEIERGYVEASTS